MQIIKLPIDAITPYAGNAKLHPAEQVDQIKKSIAQFGFNDPVAIWGDRNIIVEGHGRLLACRQLGYKEIDCIRLDHLTEEERRAYAIAHNSTNLFTSFDMDTLAKELEGISFDMSAFGLNIPDPAADVVDDSFDIDAALAGISEPRIRAGERWQLGQHRLVCGDSTKQETLDSLLGGETIDIMVTDPPYNVDYEGVAGKITNDAMPEARFYNFLAAAFAAAEKRMKKGAAFYVFYASRAHTTFEQALAQSNLIVKQQIIWVKNTFVLGRQDYQWAHEPCMYGWKDGAAHYFVDARIYGTVIEPDMVNINKMNKAELRDYIKRLREERMATTVIREDKPARNDIHPTMKPVPVVGRMIANSSRKDEIAFDGFGGGGATLIACEQLGRKCRMAEIDEKYATAIINRWEKYTGLQAQKVGTIYA